MHRTQRLCWFFIATFVKFFTKFSFKILEVAAFVTTITLSYTFSTGTQLQTRFADDSPPIFQLFPPTQPLPSLQTFPPLQLLPSQPNLWSSCGKPEFKAIDSVGLVVNGQTTVRGQFPW